MQQAPAMLPATLATRLVNSAQAWSQRQPAAAAQLPTQLPVHLQHEWQGIAVPRPQMFPDQVRDDGSTAAGQPPSGPPYTYQQRGSSQAPGYSGLHPVPHQPLMFQQPPQIQQYVQQQYQQLPHGGLADAPAGLPGWDNHSWRANS